MKKCLIPLTPLLLILLASTFFIPTIKAATEGNSQGLARVVLPVSFDFTVMDTEGEPILGASVEVKDKYGTQFSAKTGEDGSIPTQTIYAGVMYSLFVKAEKYHPFNQIFETNKDMAWGAILSIISTENVLLLILSVLSILVTARFFNKGRDMAWGAISTFMWFVNAMAVLVDNPDKWLYARIFGVFGTIMIVLTLVSVIRNLNPADQYFDDWE